MSTPEQEFGSIPEPAIVAAPSATITIGWDLGKEASQGLVAGLINPAEPNAALIAASARHLKATEAGA